MKSSGTESKRALALSWVVAVVAVLGLLPGRLAAQIAPAAKQPMKAETTSGPYKITIDRVRHEPGRSPAFAHTAFPPYGLKGSQHSDNKSFSEDKATPSGNTRTQGQTSGSGAGLSGGGGMGGTFIVPDLILDVGVRGPKTGNKTQLICGINGKVQASDDVGRTLDSPNMPPQHPLELAGVEYRRGPGRTAIHLALPKTGPAAQYLKSVDGELLVAEATVNQVTFRGKEMSRPTNKQGSGASARLHKFAQSSDGIDVQVTVVPASKAREDADPAANPMEQLRKRMLGGDTGRIGVFLEDSKGELHSPTRTQAGAESNESRETTTDGPNGSRTFTRRSTSSSGGSTSGSGSFGPGGQGGGQGNMMTPPADSKPKHDTYHFDLLPAGVTVKAIVCKVTDFVDAEPKAVPFHFENIPLPQTR